MPTLRRITVSSWTSGTVCFWNVRNWLSSDTSLSYHWTVTPPW